MHTKLYSPVHVRWPCIGGLVGGWTVPNKRKEAKPDGRDDSGRRLVLIPRVIQDDACQGKIEKALQDPQRWTLRRGPKGFWTSAAGQPNTERGV